MVVILSHCVLGWFYTAMAIFHTPFLDTLLFVGIILQYIQMWNPYVVVLKLVLMLYVTYTSIKNCMQRKELG